MFNRTTPTQRTLSVIAAIAISPLIHGAEPSALTDVLKLGDTASEKEHTMASVSSEVIAGGLGESARRLMPQTPVSYKGGRLSFKMKVDSAAQNYLTVKLWGSDKGKESGRLILFANGLQVGYRHESDYDVINQCDQEGQAPGRFLYVTLPLPLRLTVGKSDVDLRIDSLGWIWYYGANFTEYQRNLSQPTRGIYAVYTHTDPRFVPPAAEKQGAMPAAVPPPDAATAELIARSREVVKRRLEALLASKKAPGDTKSLAAELLLMAEAYQTEWTPAFHNPKILELIARDGDVMASALEMDPRSVGKTWLGAGPLGQAIMRTWPAMDTVIAGNVKVGKIEMPRRELWALALNQSVDYWRKHRRSYTNQSMIVDLNIYTANRALQLLDKNRAIPESQALRYVYESAGIEPWLGSDTGGETTGEKDVPMENIHAPYGHHYHLITKKGLSRELGYVASYGETIEPFVCEMASLLDDGKLRQQAARLQLARHYFRYPGFDAEGRHCMKLAAEVDNRTAHYPQAGGAYNSADVREAWWMDMAAMLPENQTIVGAAQQSIEDGQYDANLRRRLNDPDTLGMMRNADAWEKVSRLPPSPKRLPMTPGQPDFVFSDEENAIIAMKHGDTSLFINLYYRAERGVNRVARIFEQTPTITRIATVRTDVKVIESGETYQRPDWIDRIRNVGHKPPGETIHQAYAGEILPISKRPNDATSPKYGEWGPFLGKAAFYSLHYGEYLIGLNTTETNTYELPVPDGGVAYTDLVTGKSVTPENGILKVPPLSTVVLHTVNGK